ncbi:MAG TPA: acetoacetate decarboxylase family protein [Cellvibrio sp.]|nr:acetoacetate decarboxylase family protein [Cellvibrio sp.]
MFFGESAKKRLQRLAGRFALVDGIPYELPVSSTNSPALMSLYSIDADKAKAFLASDELHPLRLLNGRGVLVFTVIDYRETDIGKYIEYSIAIACTHGAKPAPKLLPALFMKTFKTGQCVVDLPVSTEISVKGGRGIWGMPKHQQSLNFLIKDKVVSAQYDLDGEMAVRVVIPKPERFPIPLNVAAVNYCAFRGMLMKSYVNFKTKLGFTLGKRNRQEAELHIGNHPKVQWLKTLDIESSPFVTAYLPSFEGMLDDHFECWFVTSKTPITSVPEGLEQTFPLGYGQDWPPNPVDVGDKSAPQAAAQPQSPGLTFSEKMEGGFSCDELDPVAAGKLGKLKGTVLAMHATIVIDDINQFIADPEHAGKISGSIDFTPFGKGIPTTGGAFNLFCPADSPGLKYMVYELGFNHQGKAYYLAGKKEVKDDKGFDLWTDTTTLYTRLYEGSDANGRQVGAGVLSLGVTDLLAMVKTFRPLNASSALDSSAALAKFGRFFMGELWDSYVPFAQAGTDSRRRGQR